MTASLAQLSKLSGLRKLNVIKYPHDIPITLTVLVHTVVACMITLTPVRCVSPGDQLPARVPVHVSNTEPVVLPRLGSTVYVKVSAVVSPQEFYVQLPFGAIPAQDVNSNRESGLES